MGTDRSRAYHGRCPCGSGDIEIDFCTPDHPWPTKSNWFEPTINCKECAAKYTFYEQDHQYGLVEKRELTERDKRHEAYRIAKADILSSSQAQEVISKFVSHLHRQPSKAAAHRFLVSHKLVYDSYSTYIKSWKGAEAWVRNHIDIHVESLVTLSGIIGVKDEYIAEAVMQLEILWHEYQRPLSFHNGPLLDTLRYR